MREKGFATILSLCLILVIALIVKGIQAAETNHAFETANFQTEIELQNAAESSIIAAVEEVKLAKKNGVELLPQNTNPNLANSRLKNQHAFRKIKKNSNAKFLGSITVQTWGERINIHPYEVNYKNDSDDSTNTKNIAVPIKDNNNKEIFLSAYYFFSIAQATNNYTGDKVYRRASAYILINNSGTNNETIDDVIHFMELPMSSYDFKK